MIKCGVNKTKKSADMFISLAIGKHGNLYDYSLVEYKKGKIPVKIICIKHGVFEQKPVDHLSGRGCPSCHKSKGELFIEGILKDSKQLFKSEYLIKGQRKKQYFRFDFIVPLLGIIIEYHGKQHFFPYDRFGGLSSFMGIKQRDEYKKQWAVEHGYKFLEYNYKQKWGSIKRNLLRQIKKAEVVIENNHPNT
jgi:hypothetical protein